jgi:dihydrodipicolinate synthase/N-acetylneuraminate lyase
MERILEAGARTLGGVLGPVTTPFDDAGEPDREAFERNLRAHLAAGLDGVVVVGSTGEAVLLEEEERSRLLEWARSIVPTDRVLIAGIGGESTRVTARRARDAGARGADLVLVVAPHYYGSAMTRPALDAHFRRIADESPVPLLLYNIPKYTHFTLEPELVVSLAAHGNVRGIKDSSGDLALLGGYLEAQGDDFTVLTGSATTFAPALVQGARGGILAAALFAPALCRRVLDASLRYAREEATTEQRRLTPLGAEIVGRLGVAGVKAALDAIGLAGGSVRGPLVDLAAVERRRVAELLGAAGVAIGGAAR